MHWSHLGSRERKRRLALLRTTDLPAFDDDEEHVESPLAAAVEGDIRPALEWSPINSWRGDGPAGDTRTPPELLGRLATSPDPDVRSIVAENPATSPEDLALLSSDVSDEVRKKCAGNWQTPVENLRVLSEDQAMDVRTAVAGNPFSPEDVLRNFVHCGTQGGDSFGTPRYEVAGNPALPPELLSELMSEGTDADVLRAALGNLATPTSVLDTHADDEKLWEIISHHPSASPAALAAVATSHEDWLRLAVARHRNAAPDTITLLVTDSDWQVSDAAMSHPALPAATARELIAAAGTNNYDVLRIVRSSCLPSRLLAELSTHPDKDVRAGVVGNPSTSEAVINRLAVDSATPVRAAVARSDRVRVSLLRELARDPRRDVRSAAASNPKLPSSFHAELAADANSDVRCSIAATHSVEPGILDSLASDSDPSVRIAAARNPGVPTEALGRLATDPDQYVRRIVATDSRMPADALACLARDVDSDVRAAAAANPSSPPEVLAALSKDKTAEVRRQVAFNLSTPPEVLDRLARDRAKGVRLAAARNPFTSHESAHAAQVVTRKAKAKRPTTVAERAEEILRTDLTPEDLESLMMDKAMGVRIAACIRGFECGLVDDEEAVRLLNRENRGEGQLLDRWRDTGDERLFSLMITGRFDDALLSIARDPSAPAELLNQMFELKIPTVGWMIACRDDLTADQLDHLATVASHSFETWEVPEDGELLVGQVYSGGYIACHPQIVVALHQDTRPETLTRLRKARSKHVRAAVAHRPDLEALPVLAQDKDPVVRAAVASQPLTPSDLLNELSLDAHVDVRTAVHTNPSSSEEARAQAALLGVESAD